MKKTRAHHEPTFTPHTAPLATTTSSCTSSNSEVTCDALKDIATEQDIKLLVDTFYDRVNKDEVLGPVFNDIAKVDWEHHLPTMYSFWTTMLLRKPVYKGQPWMKHAVLPLKQAHFERWISLFSQTVDSLFEGPKATEAKSAALSIADTFQTRFGIFNPFLFKHAAGVQPPSELKLTAK